jgi:hypothetical protein
MQQHDEVVSGWLNGSDNVDGCENPAGPLYIEGAMATEQAMTRSSAATNIFTTLGGTTASCRPTSCSCC